MNITEFHEVTPGITVGTQKFKGYVNDSAVILIDNIRGGAYFALIIHFLEDEFIHYEPITCDFEGWIP